LSSHGPYTDVVGANFDGQGDVKTVHLRFKSLTGDREDVMLQREQPIGIKMKFFKPSGANITNAVTSVGGYDFKVKQPKRIRLQLKATIPDPFGCLDLLARDSEAAGTGVFVAINRPADEC
jgi:hypothetical protein